VTQCARRHLEILGSQSLRPEFRISKKVDYRKVIQKGKKISIKSLQIYYLPNQLKSSRLAISISSSIKGAVVRNQQKRWIREAFRTSSLIRERCYDIVVRVRNGGKEVNFQDIKKHLEEAARQTY